MSEMSGRKAAGAAALELGIAVLAVLCGAGLWGIASTGVFDNTPLAVFSNFWISLGLGLIVASAFIGAPGQMIRTLLKGKSNNGNGDSK